MSRRLFTFGLVYDKGGEFIEEIDVRAFTSAEARELVEEQAINEYMPGYKEIVSLPAGGSGGLIETWRY